jgi:hypothetical protein
LDLIRHGIACRRGGWRWDFEIAFARLLGLPFSIISFSGLRLRPDLRRFDGQYLQYRLSRVSRTVFSVCAWAKHMVSGLCHDRECDEQTGYILAILHLMIHDQKSLRRRVLGPCLSRESHGDNDGTDTYLLWLVD